MDLFDKFSGLPDRYAEITSIGRNPLGVQMEKIKSPTEVVIEGKDVLLAGSHNYLGLTLDEDCIEAGVEALRSQGTGTTGSRIANGTYSAHQQLEDKIAKLMQCDSVILYPSGYQANLGTIAGLAGQDDYILIDADCHACIYDGCMMSGATVVRFRHNSPESLDQRLSRLDPVNSNKLIILEGLYSMYGDVAPLKEFAEVKRKHNAYLFVDEAHSVGVYGESGAGLTAETGVLDDVDFLVGTFSKSLGSIGGFCASNNPNSDFLRYFSRPYMFTASISPATVATVSKAIDKMIENPQLRADLWANAKRLHRGLESLGFKTCAPASPIISVELPDQATAVRSWNILLDAGVYVNLAIPPATPKGESLLRSSVSAAHTPAQIDRILGAYEEVRRKVNKFRPAEAEKEVVPSDSE
jgi:8-amino-7-oxononanoate synthase